MAAKEKKNTARAGALLLAAALVTTVLTSGTLAKYTETVDGTDTARVSLFDFTAEQVEEGTQELTKTGSTIDIFGTSADDTGVFGEDDTNGEKLVAPGMEGYVQFKFTNKSEVAVKVDFDTLGYENANRLPLIYYFNGRYYSDLYDTLNNRAYVYYFNEGDTVGITLDGGMDDLSAAVNAYAVMAATTEPGGVERRASAFLNTLGTSQNMSENLAINWFWPYEVRDGESVIRMDAPDTAMGKDGTYTVTMTPVVRFTQIDTYQTPATSNPGDQEWHPVQPDPGDEDITDPDNGPIAFKLAYYDSYNEKSAGEFTFYLKDDSHYTILYSDYFPGYSVPGFSYRFAADVGTEFTVDTADGAAVPASKTVNVELYHEGYDHAIDTKAGLLHIADDMDGTFILAADVDTGNSNGNYWNPIGWTDSDDVPFTGRINGNDKTVSGLHAVYGTGATYIGFVAINQGTIQNLNLDFAQLEGGRFVGAVTGSNAEGAVIENVHVKGDAVSGISGSDYGDFAGGIAGQNHGTIRRCSSDIGTGTTQQVRGVIAYNYAGGIAGGNWGVVEECYALGGISSGYRNAVNQGQLRTYYAGGLVGGNLGTIKNCYTNLQDWVVGYQRVGGFVGWNGAGGSIAGCYVAHNDRAYGAVQAAISVGENKGSVSGSYAVSATSGTVNGFSRISDSALKSAASLSGFDAAVWDFSQAASYPTLKNNPQK